MMITTVVGSYPTGIIANSEEDVRKAIEIAVKDQEKAGIQIISDGQVRTDMVGIFARAIKAFKKDGNRYKIADRVEVPDTPATVDDYKFARKVAVKAKVKGIITGPTTMAMSSSVEKSSGYRSGSDPELIYDLAYALAAEARSLSEAGASIIQIDEPFFSVGADLDTGIKAVNIVAKSIETSALHVCGDIRPIFSKLLEANVRVLDHEFSASKNLEAMDRGAIEAHQKVIGYGCVNSFVDDVDSVDLIERRILDGIEKIGKENMWLDPDCGLRMRPKQNAYQKLANLVEAARRVG